MYCTKCGKKNPDKNNYCNYCGAPLRKQPKDKKPMEKQTKEEQPKKKQPKKPFLVPLIIGIAVVAGVSLGCFFLLQGNPFGKKHRSNGAEKYYEENGEVIDKIKAKKSKEVQTEAECIDDMESRGFVQFPVEFNYSMKGEYTDSAEADGSSKSKHPVYQSYYVTPDENAWSLIIINGAVMAYPLFFNAQSTDVEVVLSETDYYTGYDIGTNTFFNVISENPAVKVIKVDRIDAETLDSYTIEVIDNEK